jgi:2,4-diketo-3-deoxy-L-fuconate hydrolase
MLALLRHGERGLAAARHVLAAVEALGLACSTRPWACALSAARILAPLPRPGKILCSGVNYRGHLDENPRAQRPDEPFFFAKMPSAVVGPGAPIIMPPQTRQLDYEVELAVIIGRRMKAISEADALACIAGYTILHDVSARDIQFKDNQITLGKNFDTFCPMGPCLVTADEFPHPECARLRSYVNGVLRQDGSNTEWIFPLSRLLHALSRVMTLEPGDVVSTGTPAGVGLFQKPPCFLAPGDVVRLEIEGIGILENPIVAA